MNQSSNSTGLYEYQKKELNLYYAICEILVAIVAVVGNALVIFVFKKERRLRRRTNYYIVSLAAADFLVGLLGIPFAIMSSIGLPVNLHACLFTVSLLVVLCTISIFCLVAVSVDRYWAILHPMGYSRNVRTKTAIVIISICWVMGGFVGFLPLMGWHKDARSDESCFFLDVMDYNYLVFLYFGTIITPALLLAAFYAHIYQVILKQLRQIVTMNPENGTSTPGCSSGGTMLRMLGAAQKREVKATQNLAIIVLFFMICWIPLYTINCILAFCHTCNFDSSFMLSCIILSHLNSAGNPLLYAYHLKDFRAALKNFFYRLFGYAEQNSNQLTRTIASNNNHYISRTLRSPSCHQRNSKSIDMQLYQRKKSLENNKIAATMVKNSTNIAVVPTGEIQHGIWDIPEASSASSEDSLQEQKSRIIRPATPYHPRHASDLSQINQIFYENSMDNGKVASTADDNDDDDVFLDETLIFNDFKYKDNILDVDLGQHLRRDVQIIPSKDKDLKTISNSSPQLLTKSLFFIENSTDFSKPSSKPKFGRSSSLIEKTKGDEVNRYRLSPFKIFKSKQSLGRSLSDEGTITSDESFTTRKPSGGGTILRSSCGS